MASRSPWKRERDGQQVAVEKRDGQQVAVEKTDGQQVAVEKTDGQQVAVEKTDGQLTRTWRRVLESAGFRVSRLLYYLIRGIKYMAKDIPRSNTQ